MQRTKAFCIKDKILKYRQDWLYHVWRDPHRQLPRVALYHTLVEKETEEGPESIGLIKKPEQACGVTLLEDDGDDDVIFRCCFSTIFNKIENS